MSNISNYFILFLKGIGMGGANVIPGVSGGTIALITGIFERLIYSIKSFDLIAIKLLFQGKFKDFAVKTDLQFLIVLFAGIIAAIFSLARLFDFLFKTYPVYIWAFFFGLVLASVFFVGKKVKKWNTPVIISLVVGAVIAIIITFLNPARPNDNVFYLFLCGAVGICTMLLPGLSGSFVVLLMGNYQLIAIDAINNLDLGILLPFIAGAAFGLIAFSHLLSWIFKNFPNQTISLLCGFILGSLSILWPWKEIQYLINQSGEFILKNGEKINAGYRNFLPEGISIEVIYALLFAIAGIVSIWLIEYFAQRKNS